MIPDLLKLRDVPKYVRQRTGVSVSLERLIKTGEIEVVQPPKENARFRYTTKKAVDRFIRGHVKNATANRSKAQRFKNARNRLITGAVNQGT